METLGAKFFDTIIKSKAHDCKCNLSSMVLKGNKIVRNTRSNVIRRFDVFKTSLSRIKLVDCQSCKRIEFYKITELLRALLVDSCV